MPFHRILNGFSWVFTGCSSIFIWLLMGFPDCPQHMRIECAVWLGIWKPSSIGVGAVVGGEVFNVLVIIGTAVLATPKEYLPLKLSKTSFIRD